MQTKLKLQLGWAFFISLILASGFAFLALSVSKQKIVYFDKGVTDFVQRFESPVMTFIMKGITLIGSAGIVFTLILLQLIFLYKVLKHRKELILFTGVIVGSLLLNVWFKILFHRARPDLHRIIDAAGFSFPSGHSTTAFSLYGIFAFLVWRHLSTSFGRICLILLSAVMIIAIGVSRIYLGVHYPSDVLGGYLVSGTWLALSIWIYQHYMERWGAKSAKRLPQKT